MCAVPKTDALPSGQVVSKWGLHLLQGAAQGCRGDAGLLMWGGLCMGWATLAPCSLVCQVSPCCHLLPQWPRICTRPGTPCCCTKTDKLGWSSGLQWYSGDMSRAAEKVSRIWVKSFVLLQKNSIRPFPFLSSWFPLFFFFTLYLFTFFPFQSMSSFKRS